MIRIAAAIGLVVLLVGCGSSSAGTTATPTLTLPTASATATEGAGPQPSKAPSTTASAPTSTPQATPRSHPRPTRTVVVAPAYVSFIRMLCQTLGSSDAAGVDRHLMHYQYNSGLRWGLIGDGEGTTSDPSLMYTWLSGSHVRCRSFSPSNGGHGTLMTVGWAQPGPWSLLDLDLLNGQWVINDFTFGSPARLAQAMHGVTKPVMRYRG